MKIGDKIYVDSHFYIDHGEDDVVGGLATVSHITESNSNGKKCLFVAVEEHPGVLYNWDQVLSEQQDMLKKDFGKQKAFADPDYT